MSQPLWTSLRNPNRRLWMVLGFTLVMLFTAVCVPWAQAVLRFAPLPPVVMAIAGGLGLLSAVWFELIKTVRVRT